MGRHVETLDGGLWSAPDPGLLQPGQLSDGRNWYYLPGTKGLVRSRGRSAFGTVTASADNVAGLRSLQFDNGDAYMVAMASGIYRYSAVGDTGTFSTLTTFTGVASQLERVQYRNRYYLFNGLAVTGDAIGSNLAAYLSATGVGTAPTTRQHGMLPVNATPQITTAAGTFTQTVTGYYEYWTTEVAKVIQDGAELNIESTYNATPATVLITTASMVPIIARPPLRNAITTHWRLYRSAKKELAIDRLFPAGFMIAEMTTAASAQADGTGGANTGFIFPSAVSTGAAPFHQNVANASAMFVTDGNNATFSPAGVTGAGRASQGLYGFSFGGVTGSIGGFEVVVKARVSSGSTPQWMQVAIGARDTANGGFQQDFTFGKGTVGHFTTIAGTKAFQVTAGSLGDYTVGASADKWLDQDISRQLVDADLTTTGFLAVVDTAGSGYAIEVDSIKVKAYYGAASTSVVQFPTVVYTFGDSTVQVGKNGQPPSSSTGDIFEDCLVVNDVTAPSQIKWSYPGDPEAFPASYFLDFETEENDQVRLIKVVNQRLVVALDSSAYRVNYLPSERDATFDRGRAYEAISRSYGAVNPMCGCVYSPGGGSERLAVVAHQGIWDTDGFDFRFLTTGIDWRRTIIGLTSTSTPVALINDPERQLLLFYFRNDSYAAGERYLCLPLSYANDHLQGDAPKVGGLLRMRNHSGGQYGDLKSAWPIRRSTGSYDVYLGYGGATAAGAGTVYRENGSTIPAEDDGMTYTSRGMYLAGHGQEFRISEMYGYGSVTGTQGTNYTFSNAKTNDPNGQVAGPTKAISLSGQKLWKVSPSYMSERLTVQMSVTAGDDDRREEFLILEGDGFGLEDSGK